MLAKTRSQPLSSTRSGTVRRLGLLVVGCLAGLVLFASDASAGQLPVGLGAADSFAALAGTTVTNTGFSTLNGDLGVSPGSALTGFPPGKVNGTVHATATDPVAKQAQSDLTAAYNDAAGRTPPIALPADVGGRTLAPGVYKSDPSLGLTGALTLDGQGDPNAVFIFQVGSALTTSVASRVNLIGGAQACNVFWQIGSSATLGTSSTFAGSILALSSISINDGVTLNGRALARNGAVTLINDTITAAHCTAGTTPGGTTPGGTTPGGTTPGGTTPGGTTPGGTTGGDTRPPAPPVLLSPRAHARVRAGIVSFSWRPAARAERYTLMVDHHRMNTGPRTRAAMFVSIGSHSYRVIAQNRYEARSSRHRSFRVVTATKSPSVDAIRVRVQELRTTVHRIGSPRAEAMRAARPGVMPECTISPAFIGTEGLVIPTSIDFSIGVVCARGGVRSGGAYIVNSRGQRVSEVARCVPVSRGSCRARGTYQPMLGSYTRQLGLHLSLVLFTGSRRTVFLPQDKRTALQCRVFGSPLLKCRFTDKFISLDHRCDLTPVTRSFPPVPESELYPSNQTPLAPFIDGRGRASRLFWGRETELPAPEFYSGKGYRHIAAKHGWGPADEQATRNAIHTRPITTETTKVKRRRLVRRTYEGGGYRQNLASCRRVVVIDYPIRSRSGGEMITSYGALVGEPGSPLPSQG